MGLLMFFDLKIIFKENWLSLDCVVYPNKEIQVLFGTASSKTGSFTWFPLKRNSITERCPTIPGDQRSCRE